MAKPLGLASLYSSFLAVFKKEFLHIRRDRATLITALTIPLFQLILFGFIDQTVKKHPHGGGQSGPDTAG